MTRIGRNAATSEGINSRGSDSSPTPPLDPNMTIHSGLYKIFTKANNGQLFVGLSRDPDPSSVIGGIPVLAGPKPVTTIVEVCDLGGDRYQLHLWYHSGLGIGYKSKEFEHGDEVIALSDAGEWVIEEGSQPRRYKIRVPDTELYWTIAPGVVDETPIALHPLEGKPAEEWTFEVQREH